MKKKVLSLLAVTLFLTVGQVGAAGLNVNTTAAISGTYGLEVSFSDATTNPAFVIDTTPNNEIVYRAEFDITLADTFDFGTALPQPTPALRQQASHLIFMMKDLDQPPGPNRTHAAVFLKKISGTPDRFLVWARLYAPTAPEAASDGFVYRGNDGAGLEHTLPTHISGYPVTVRVEWRQASSPGASDGLFLLSKDNNFAPGSFTLRGHTALPNGDKDIDQVELGAVGGVDAQTVGSYYLDDFSSFRTLVTP